MDIQVGEHANDYQEIAAKDKLTELQLRIRQLLDQVEQISKEQNYQRVSQTDWSVKSCRYFAKPLVNCQAIRPFQSLQLNFFFY